MTGERGRPLSRRDLLGIFGRGARGFGDALGRELPGLAPGGGRPASPAPSSSARFLRPASETVPATPDESHGWTVDLRTRPLEVGGSLRVAGGSLAEPLLLVRVHPGHVGVVSGECPVEGSDLLWDHEGDRAHCPSCRSRWRLDGNVAQGPADSPLASFVAEETAGVVHVRRA